MSDALTDTDKTFLDQEMDVPANMPEAPASIHIDAYYKGFHVGLTRRYAEGNVVGKVNGIKTLIDSLVDQGFEASWNKQTSEQHKNGVQTAVVASPTAPEKVLCKECGVNYHDAKWPRCFMCSKKMKGVA